MHRWTLTVFVGASFAGASFIAPRAFAEWGGLVDKSVELQTNTYSFIGSNPEAGQSNENYYDGDIGDFDGDRLPDRILGARYGLLFNTGSGLMVPARKQVGFLLRGDPGASGWGEDAFQFADIDGDGDLDGIAGGNGEPLTAQLNGSGRFRIGWIITGGNHSALNIVNTDVERDGDVDLAVAHSFCSTTSCGGPVQFALFINDGSGAMTEQASARGLAFTSSDFIVGVVSGDVDGDGDFDLVLQHGAGNQIIVGRNNGSGQYVKDPQPLPTTCSGFGQGTTLGDVDDDGDLDLALGRCGQPYAGGHPSVSHVIGINDGNGNFDDESAARLDPNGFSSVPFIAGGNSDLVDIDYDGDLDFLDFHKDNQAGYTHFAIFSNDGAGYFTYEPTHSVFKNEPAQALGNDVDIADLDGNGTFDVWVGVSGGDVRLLLNSHQDPLGADVPRNVEAVVNGGGIDVSWDHPPFAATARFYRVYRATGAGLEPRDKKLVKTVGMSPFQDEAFSAPITRHTTTSELGDPAVALNGDRVTFTDASARPGVTYHYTVVHVGTENNASAPSAEANAALPAGAETTGPELDIVSPNIEDWSRFARIVLLYGDESGVDPATLEVSVDQPLGGGMRAAGANLTDLAYRNDDGAFILALAPPLDLPMDTLVTVNASIADTLGNVTTASRQFFVSVDSPIHPSASFVANAPPQNPLDFSADASSDSDGKIMRWEWYFGDGTTGLGRNIHKQYTYGGTYDVTLLVRDDQGGVATSTQTITVDGPAPPPGSGGGGGAGAGSTSSGAGGADAQSGDEAGQGGCGCTLPGQRSEHLPLLLAVLGLALAMRRRPRLALLFGLLMLVACGEDGDEQSSMNGAAGPSAGSTTATTTTSSAAVGGGGGTGGSMSVGGAGGAAGGVVESTFVTYLGGSAFEQARDVTVDGAGNIIAVGGTASPDFPVTAGAYDTTFATGGSSLGTGGPMDVFVAKYSPSGELLWATFVGGPNYDRAYAVEVDAAGDVYVAGRAGDQFPTTAGVVQTTFADDTNANGLYGKQDGFVFKLSSDGTTLLWSTYFGGGGYEFIRDMDIDASGSVYVGVAGAAAGFPHITSGAYDTTHNGGNDAVLAKLSPDGTQVVWGSYFGGSGTEGVPSVRVNAAGELHLATASNSTNLPTTSGAYQTIKKNGTDFFVAKLSADGASLVFCTWFGGNGNEGAETHHVALDPSGAVVIGAETQSTDLPTTNNAHKATLSGTGDAFIAKLSADGSSLLAATYLGGGGWDAIQGVAVDAAGNIYVGGTTPSDNLPATSSAYQTSYGGNGDGWAAWLSSDLSTVHHLTYLGAGQDDQQRSLWIDGAGNIVSTGQSASMSFPVTSAAPQASYAGSTDAYVAAFVLH